MRTRSRAWLLASTLAAGLASSPAGAGEADVLAARARCDDRGRCGFEVRVRHADEGWSHYADRWEVVTTDGRVLATRVLAHPHVDEQPFTRSLPPVAIPPEIRSVVIRAHDSMHGLGGRELRVELPR